MKRVSFYFLLVFVPFNFLVCTNLFSQETLEFQKPPKEILDIFNYKKPPTVRIDSNNENIILFYRDNYKSLRDLNEPIMRLAGVRINPVTNIESSIKYEKNIKILRVGEEREIQVTGLPENPKISNIQFSPDESLIAFTHTSKSGVELWILNIKEAHAKPISKGIVNASLGKPYSWLKDSNSLIVRVIPSNRAELIDKDSYLPSGPVISESEGQKSQIRTYQDLLHDRVDEMNFETLVKSELFIYDVHGNSKKFLREGLYTAHSVSPDGNYVMVTTIERPYSYIVKMDLFPKKSIVYNLSGKMVKVVNEVPLNELSPKGHSNTREGKRNLSWRADRPATLFFVKAIDGGNGAKKVDNRDQIFQWEAPFDRKPLPLVEVPQRFYRVLWGDNTRALFMDRNTKNQLSNVYLFNPSDSSFKPILLYAIKLDDKYFHPGEIQMKKNEYSHRVIKFDKNSIYLVGDGFTNKGQFPFIDKLNLKSLVKNRVYQSGYIDKLEEIKSINSIEKGNILVQIQSQIDYPNYYLRNIRKKRENLTKITNFENPIELLSNVHKEVIKYKREDGVELSGILYLPVGYDLDKKERVPMLLWAYPREYKDVATASRSTLNQNRYTLPSYGSFIYWVNRGYAVLQKAAFPIIGVGDNEPNDTYIEQLVMNAKAAINAVDSLGYIDREKVAVGGHSYGAFMTANLLSHSDLFACGIARSGAYNRTLTPFGFQNERRNYWDIPDLYNTMSPFMSANKMKTPILLIHGEADNNTGTHTMQTERYFQALKGLGAPVRMVILPRESHGYVAKENILHLLWEQDRFFEKYLKGE